ncbi:MAG TPA: neutral/alkaline non-lysosomal ceramidase N-terminal domain-containing protein [Solirubrobacteraceae bacterium]
MRGKWMLAVLACAVATGTSATTAQAGQLRAGVGKADASWHVGASAGQYASGRQDSFHIDPHVHQVKNAPSYGVQSRLSMRAVVVQETGGEMFALVKHDLYLSQDLLYRRAAQLLEGTGIDRTNLTIAATHNHSSPYYTSTAWGAWAFQDVFDIRAYDYYAQAIADAVKDALVNMKDVRVGAAATYFDRTHRNAMGPALADDLTPAGYPNAYADHDLTVVRFDDKATGKPLALLVNYSLHPEMLDGNDLISADYLGPLERMVDRATGALTIYTQNAVGAAEPERSSYHSYREREEFTHREYSQAEWAARQMAETIIDTSRNIARGTPDERYADRYVAPVGDAKVDFEDRWFPGPLTHPYPAVSNCRTNKNFSNVTDPQLPIVGLPDCAGPSTAFDQIDMDYPVPPQSAGVTTDQLKAAGIPVPDNYGAPSFTGLEENVDVHLQAFRIGDILFTVCSCEQWADQSYNIKSRTDRVEGNETLPGTPNLGFDWSERCNQVEGGWSCPHPQRECPPREGRAGTFECWTERITITDEQFRHMQAQVNNDAHGWNSPEYARYAESEPTDPDAIKGNYTHDDNAHSAALGYKLTVPISMANDYNGYIASYREFQRGDHYRKALTGWGPHSSDYMATRLVKLGRLMQNPSLGLDETVKGAETKDGVPDVDADSPAFVAKTEADVAQNDVRARAIGEAAKTLVSAYEGSLPDDAGHPSAKQQPDAGYQRFDLATFSWVGGSNYVDNPDVRVERRESGRWVQAADMSGEVVSTLAWPDGSTRPDAPLAYRQGDVEFVWTAHFEPFVSRFNMPDVPRATPEGTYRFVVSGRHRDGRATKPYTVISRAFVVGPWAGVTAYDVKREPDGRVSLAVGPRRDNVRHFDQSENPGSPVDVPIELGPIDYPDTYTRRAAKADFITGVRRYSRDPAAPGDPSRFELYCIECSFRPWLDVGDAERVRVTFASADGATRKVSAQRSGDRWVTDATLAADEVAYVCPGQVRDPWRNFNKDLSPVVGDAPVRLDCNEPLVVGETPGDGRSGDRTQPARDFGADGPGGVGPRETGLASSLGLPAAAPSSARAGAPAARPAAPSCRRTRSLRIRLRAPRRGLRIRRATVLVNGRRARTLRGRAARSAFRIRLRGRTTVVTVRMRASDGRTYVMRRAFRRCVRRR